MKKTHSIFEGHFWPVYRQGLYRRCLLVKKPKRFFGNSMTDQKEIEWPEINGKAYVKKKDAAKNIQNCFPG